MTFEDDLREVQAERERSSRLEADRIERERALLAEAVNALAVAAATLETAGVATITARTAHKDRGNWTWPMGKGRVEGWWLQCGDVGLVLRTDGWLAGAHRCNDPKQTPCACPFSEATSAVPAGIYLPGASDNGEESTDLNIRTTVEGQVQDLAFNRWLAEQVAGLLAPE